MAIAFMTSACNLPSLTRRELFEASKKAGYPGVELFAGWTESIYDPSKEEPSSLQGEGVAVSALHLPGDLEGGKKALALAAKAGVPRLIAHGSGAPAEAEQWLAPLIPESRELNIDIVVTNHKGQSVESPSDVKMVLDSCGDNAPWVLLEAGQYWAAGYDASEALGRFQDRVRLVHIKDLDEKGNSVPFGQGCSPVKEFMRDLAQTGYDGAVTVELELGDTPVEEVISHMSHAREYLEGSIE